MGAYTSYDKVYDGNIYTFGTVYNVVVYGRDSGTTVSDSNIQYTRIDSYRTLAVNVSYLVGVKDSSGDFSYYPMNAYIEFYASGSGGYWY